VKTIESADKVVQAAVVDELQFTPSIDSTYITVAVNRGAVTLFGDVGTFPEKRHAERAALRVRGVNSVAEQLMVRSVWGIASDAVIANSANEALERAVDVPTGCVTATVHERHVTLTGSTPWQYQRAACARAVRALHGVAGVVNDVTVRPTFTPDGIGHAITTALMRSAQLAGHLVVVTATGGDVTLEGTVHTWAERHEAEYAAWSAPGVTNVNNHINIRQGPLVPQE
jgi:osmotically-inducible protein OsmY